MAGEPREEAAAAGVSPGRRLDLAALKWLAIVLPLLFLGAADVARERLFHGGYSMASRLFFFALLAVAISLFSHGVFRAIGRLQDRIVHQNERLAALNAIAMAAAERPGLEPVLEVSLDQVLGVLRADAGIICAVDLERREHSAVASRGFSDELVRSIQRAKLCDDPIALEVVETGRQVVLERLLADPRVSQTAEREGVRSAISVPLKSHGEVTGVMAVASRAERSFGKDERELLANVGGQLGMAIRQTTVFERSLQRNREMEALLAVSNAVASSLDLPEVLDGALEAILAVTSAEAAEIWLAEDDGALALARHRGTAPDVLHEATRLRAGEGPPGLATARRAPVLVHDMGGDPRSTPGGVGDGGLRSYCALPLLRRGEAPLGVLGVAARAQDSLGAPEELRLLAGIGEVIGVAIENARLHERVQDTAVLEERDRIAREMHDGLAQILTYVNAQSLAIGKLLASGSVANARRELARLEAAVQDVYADVREAILGLRTSPRSAGGLLPSLSHYLESFEEMTGIRARLEVQADAAAIRLSSSAEIQLTRIVQEALSNVRKHARAHAVTVGVELVGAELRVLVEDDGQGFDPAHLPPLGWPRFGLQTMRERAEAVGGSFAVRSRPGGGTGVVIALAPERREAGPPTSAVAVAVGRI